MNGISLKKPPLMATIFALLALIILCKLGLWQIERLHWKLDILARLDAAYAKAGPDSPPLDFSKADQDDFLYGKVQGIWRPGKVLLLGPRVKDGKIGADVIAPLQMADGREILINLGWSGEKDKTRLPIYADKGRRVVFSGLARKMDWNAFTPDNRPDKDEWYKPDIAEIAAVKGLRDPLPLFLFADYSSAKLGGGLPDNERWQPRNEHLNYAIFWFSMAGVLAVIFTLRFVVVWPPAREAQVN